MKKYLLPDYDFPTFVGVTPEFLKSIGKNAVLCDIDNTLVPYDQALPTDEVCEWVKNLQNNGIKIAFVSNNEKERVEKFNENIGIPYLYKSGKPSRKTVKRGTALLGSKYEENHDAWRSASYRRIDGAPFKNNGNLGAYYKKSRNTIF